MFFHVFEIAPKSMIQPNKKKKEQLFLTSFLISLIRFSPANLSKKKKHIHDQESELQQWFRHNIRVQRRGDINNDFQFCTCDDSLIKTTSLIFLRDVNFDKNKFYPDKNKSFMNVDGIVKYWSE